MMNASLTPHRRIRFLTLAVFAIMAIFIARLFIMQVVQHERYEAMAIAEQVKSLAIPADRGEIYALDGSTPVKLVLNEAVYTVFVDPQEVTEPSKIIKVVRDVAGGTVSDDIEALVSAKESRYKIVAKNVTRKQAELMKKENLRGLGFQETTRRVYPEGTLAAQTLGFVNSEGNGQYGIEGGLDKELQGSDGMLRSVTDVSNVPLTIGKHNIETPKQDGKNVVLTIDRNVQSYAETALKNGLDRIGATNGSVLVMDPRSGKVLSMANYPTYNPEEYFKVADAEAFNNGTISTPYEPGSVIKTFTVATGIDQGVISPASTFVNTDRKTVEDIVITNATKGQTGEITMQHALNWSLNTGMVTVAERLGNGSYITKDARSTMYEYFHDRFGLGQATDIPLAGEQEGYIISPEDVQGNAVRYSNMSFGQGMNPTMLQVSAGFSSIINGGSYYKPSIIAGEVNEREKFQPAPDPSPVRRTISEDSSKEARKMIRDARRAFYADNDKPGYEIGGKTGTSETLVDGRYAKNQTTATYLGYGGDSEPKYVIMVKVAAPGKYLSGADDALPIFTDISNWMIDYMKLQPNR